MAGIVLGGRYRLLEELGAGGMAVVWRGYDEVLGRQVAIKVPEPHLSSDEVFIRRLRAEAQAVARLSHPHITSVHDYGRNYVVMELVQGETLSSVLSGGRSLPWREAVTICAEIAMALSAAHEHGIVHRDISANNIMLTAAGVKVLDFGISAFAGEGEPADPHDLVGTPAYVAPERLRQAEITPAVDVYALGIVLYRCLRGALPWAAEDPDDLFQAHLWLTPAPLPPVPGMPRNVARLCYRCLAKDPAERPTSAELAAALSKLAGINRHAPAVQASPVDITFELPTTVVARPAPVRRKMFIAAVCTAGLLLSGAWVTGQAKPTAQWNEPLAAPPALPAASTVDCHVTYQVTSDDGHRFAAQLMVRGEQLGHDAELRFPWPGDQHLTAADPATWQQDGREVTLRAAAGTQTVGLTGEYASLNALPATFQLNGTACTSTLVGAPPLVLVQNDEDQGRGKNKKKGDDDEDDD